MPLPTLPWELVENIATLAISDAFNDALMDEFNAVVIYSETVYKLMDISPSLTNHIAPLIHDHLAMVSTKQQELEEKIRTGLCGCGQQLHWGECMKDIALLRARKIHSSLLVSLTRRVEDLDRVLQKQAMAASGKRR